MCNKPQNLTRTGLRDQWRWLFKQLGVAELPPLVPTSHLVTPGQVSGPWALSRWRGVELGPAGAEGAWVVEDWADPELEVLIGTLVEKCRWVTGTTALSQHCHNNDPALSLWHCPCDIVPVTCS